MACRAIKKLNLTIDKGQHQTKKPNRLAFGCFTQKQANLHYYHQR